MAGLGLFQLAVYPGPNSGAFDVVTLEPPIAIYPVLGEEVEPASTVN